MKNFICCPVASLFICHYCMPLTFSTLCDSFCLLSFCSCFLSLVFYVTWWLPSPEPGPPGRFILFLKKKEKKKGILPPHHHQCFAHRTHKGKIWLEVQNWHMELPNQAPDVLKLKTKKQTKQKQKTVSRSHGEWLKWVHPARFKQDSAIVQKSQCGLLKTNASDARHRRLLVHKDSIINKSYNISGYLPSNVKGPWTVNCCHK